MPNHQARLGPILYARSSTATQWKFAIGLLIRDSRAKKARPKSPPKAPPVHVTLKGKKLAAPKSPAGNFWSIDGSCFWVWEVSVPRGADATFAEYALKPAPGHRVSDLPREPIAVPVPAKGKAPRIAFFSCNGYSDAEAMRKATHSGDPFALWGDIACERESEGGLHLMIGGGDQIYADSLWHTVDELDDIRGSRSKQEKQKPSAGFAERMRKEYLNLYVTRWRESGFATQLSRLPSAHTWDDHDIFDGYGSYGEELQESRYFRSIFKAADEMFRVFQLGGSKRPLGVGAEPERAHHLQALRVPSGDVDFDVLLLDLRSERSLKQVMSGEQWWDLKEWLDRRVSEGRRGHLLVVSSIPIIYMRFSAWQERVARVADLDDDMRDQWESKLHQGERVRLMMTLLEHANRSQSRVTVLSGDIHVGSRGRLVSIDPDHRHPGQEAGAIEQLTSSAIVHPPPSGLQFALMKAIGGEREEDIAPGVSTRLLPVGCESYLRDRNWMTLEFDARKLPSAKKEVRLWAQWRTLEGPVEPYAVVGCEV